MAEFIFILITLYATYVIHSVLNEPEAPTAPPDEKKPAMAEEVKISNPAPKAVPAPRPVNRYKTPEGHLRHPDSGEIVKIASTYRMLKRWIKEALVTEGLLDKIYKVNEIDASVQTKIDEALKTIQTLEKYR